MKGLSIISASFTLSEAKKFWRNDPHYYAPINTFMEDILIKGEEDGKYRVKQLCQVAKIVDVTENPENKDEFNYIDIGTNKGQLLASGYKLKGSEAPSRARRKVKKGDLLTAVSGSQTGKEEHVAVLVPDELDGSIASTGFEVIRPVKANSYYLLLLFNHSIIKKQIFRRLRGSAIPAVWRRDLKNILVPINEKLLKISNKLRQAIEAKIEAEKKRKEVIDIYTEILPNTTELIRYKKEISTIVKIQDARKIGRVDPQYFSKWIKQVINCIQQTDYFYLEESKFSRGKTPSEKEYKNSGVFVVKVRNILQDGRIEVKGEKSYIDETNFERNYKNFTIEYGDIIFVATGKGSIGRVGIFLQKNLKAICSGELLVYREPNETKRWLILGLFLQSVMQEVLDKIALGPSGQTHLYPRQITKIPIPKFSESKIKILVNSLSNYFSLMDKSLQLYSQAMGEVNKLLGLNSGGNKLWKP